MDHLLTPGRTQLSVSSPIGRTDVDEHWLIVGRAGRCHAATRSPSGRFRAVDRNAASQAFTSTDEIDTASSLRFGAVQSRRAMIVAGAEAKCCHHRRSSARFGSIVPAASVGTGSSVGVSTETVRASQLLRGRVRSVPGPRFGRIAQLRSVHRSDGSSLSALAKFADGSQPGHGF